MIYAIGDIHGERDKLRYLMRQIDSEITDSDRLVFLGDYVDRGPDTRGVLDDLLATQADRPNTIFLRGNHEQLLMEARAAFEGPLHKADYEGVAHWFAQGGSETLASYPRPGGTQWYERIPANHWEFLRNTRSAYCEGPYMFVHAGVVPPGVEYAEPEPWLWIREPFLSSTADLGAIVVFGHTPLHNGLPLVMPNKIGIDTAATYGGPLTAAALDPATSYERTNVRFIQSHG